MLIVALAMTWAAGDSQEEKFETARGFSIAAYAARRRPGAAPRGSRKRFSYKSADYYVDVAFVATAGVGAPAAPLAVTGLDRTVVPTGASPAPQSVSMVSPTETANASPW